MNRIGIIIETMDFCTESTCKHYYEDNCMYPTGHTKYHKGLVFDYPKNCPMYQKGKHDGYYYQDRKKISAEAKAWNEEWKSK